MGLQENIKNGLISVPGFSAQIKKNTPEQYKDKRFPYFEAVSDSFVTQYAQYASDFVAAEVEVPDETGALYWKNTMVRFSNAVSQNAAITRRFDEYKNVLFADESIGYLPPGTKLRALGSVWLAINPDNLSSVSANGIFRHCNAVWNYLDYYGNVVSEPICVENARANANTPDSEYSMVVAAGYFNVICQYNENTAQIDDNTRMVFGSRSYMVSGFSDFQTEFTGDYSSVRMLHFAVRVEEKNRATDDMERHVAGGKDFNWAIAWTGATLLQAGEKTQMLAESVRNGVKVAHSELHPISYRWSSDNPEIATVDQSGTVTALQAGNATITATLEQNPEIQQQIYLTVIQQAQGNEVRFLTAVPDVLAAYQSVTLSAAVFTNGVQTEQTVTFTFSGPPAQNGAWTAETDGNSVTIRCWRASDTPLVITASYDTVSAAETIRLEGI